MSYVRHLKWICLSLAGEIALAILWLNYRVNNKEIMFRIRSGTLRYNPEGREFDSRWNYSFRPHCRPGVDKSTRVSLGGKDDRCVGLTLPPSCTDCLELLGALTSWTPKSLSKPVYGYLLSVRRARDFSVFPSCINRIWGAPRLLSLRFWVLFLRGVNLVSSATEVKNDLNSTTTPLYFFFTPCIRRIQLRHKCGSLLF